MIQVIARTMNEKRWAGLQVLLITWSDHDLLKYRSRGLSCKLEDMQCLSV